ncbi:MAG: SpoIIE family protein phosphatase [Bacteroidia bacterium]|nr:SpoIIE family protein phosphatase [Bacteroidia bacterium]
MINPEIKYRFGVYIKKYISLNAIVFISILLQFIFVQTAIAQKQKISFYRITSREGLSVDRVICIFQDSRGIIWVGTTHGLNMYDGYKFTVFQNDPRDPHSLSNNSVWSIYEDRVGILWVGTSGGGLNKFNRENYTFTVYQNDPENPHSISDNYVWSLLEDKSGYLWAGTENGLNRFDKKSNVFTCFKNNPDNQKSISNNAVWALLEDRTGSIWIATSEGLNRYDKQTNDFTVFKNDEKNPASLSNNSVWSLFEDPAGTLWIGTSGGLNKYDRNTGKFTRFLYDISKQQGLSENKVLSILQDHAGNFWTGSDNGLYLFNKDKSAFTIFRNDPNNPAGISDNSIWSVIEDKTGNIWFGTDGGLNKYNPDAAKFRVFQNDPGSKNSLSENTVWMIYSDRKNILWVGTDNGLNQYDKSTGKFIVYRNNPKDKNSVSNSSILSILEDSEGYLWVGTDDGLNRINLENMENTIYKNDKENPNSISNNSIWSLAQDNEGNIWAGTSDGLNRINYKDGKITVFKNDPAIKGSLSHNKVLAIFKNSMGELWIGTANGLNKYDPAKNMFSVYLSEPGKPSSLSNNKILCLAEDSKGYLWIGTNGGLNKMILSKNGKVQFRSWLRKDGLPDNKICGILSDAKNNLWISTKNGLCKFTPPPGDKCSQAASFYNFDTDDGLPNREFFALSFCKDQKGCMYFGGISGFISFFPDSIKASAIKPPIIITSFQLFNKEVEVFNPGIHTDEDFFTDDLMGLFRNLGTRLIKKGDKTYLQKSITQTGEITLNYKDNVFSFEFASLHYSKSDRDQYAYKMEGFDDDWNYVGNKRNATYIKLPPDEYTFKVKGTNSDGIWNENGASIRVIVLPPFWQTWWFRILVVILAVFSVFYYIRWREKKLKRDKERLEQIVKIRTAEVVKQKEEILEKNEELTQQKEEITAQRDEIEAQRDEIQIQKQLIENKNQEVMDSIHYAKRIQHAILPPEEYVSKNLPEHFVLFKPRDIVSGDFYWVKMINYEILVSDFSMKKSSKNFLIFCVADCTGHGVPGAFMSMLGTALLNEIVNKYTFETLHTATLKASDILDQLRENLITALHQTGKEGEQKDGMDIALCIYNMEAQTLQYAGANNPIYIVETGESHVSTIREIRPDKMPIGIHSEENPPFKNHFIELQKGDAIYLFSDGFADQFGGPRGKKFMYKQLKDLLLVNSHLSMEKQKVLLEHNFDNWMGGIDQVDDVTVIGMRI